MAGEAKWLLLIHQVPPKPDYLRVKVRRRLQEIGAVAIKSTVYALPRSDQALEDFQWTLREIAKVGGQGAICSASFVGGLDDDGVAALFRAARKDSDAGLVAKGRFLSLIGLTFLFTVFVGGGHPLKLALLTFGLTVCFVTSMADVVSSEGLMFGRRFF